MPSQKNTEEARRPLAIDHEEFARAQEEDVLVKRILLHARSSLPLHHFIAEKRTREAVKIMERMHAGSNAAFVHLVKDGKLISKNTLLKRLGRNRRWLPSAVRAGRIFSVKASWGKEYFPSFFADAAHDRRVLGRVAKTLGTVPGASKYYFFTTKFNSLGMSPLEALLEKRLTDVLRRARGFSER